jgi:pseudouridine-5'-phosphate glycosidase
MNQFLQVQPEIREALATQTPVVALESTIISHGMPYPQNVETAWAVEQTVRENGAIPATIAIINGKCRWDYQHRIRNIWQRKKCMESKSA